MKQTIYRNIAAVSAIFIVTLSIMLIINYFQVKEVSPLQSVVVETLKQLNDQNANNPELQEQIRQLDLMARKAYFLNMDHLKNGVYLLLGMLAVFLICIRMYFTGFKDIPDKEIDPIDEWAIQSSARKYIGFAGISLVALAAVFIVFSIPLMQPTNSSASEDKQELLAKAEISEKEKIVEAQESSPLPVNGEIKTTANETQTSAEEIETKAVQSEVETSNTEPVEKEEVEPVIKEQVVENDTEVKEKVCSEEAPAANEVKEEIALPRVNSNAFRGHYSNGKSEAKNLPVKWDLANGTNIAWQTKVTRKGQSSPVINGHKVFITGGDEEARELFCYDLNTGENLWTLSVANIPGSPAKVPDTTDDTGLASASVATNGLQVCAIFGTGDLVCTDMDGKQLWAKNLGVPDNHYGYASSLIIEGNSLFVQYDNNNTHKVYALNTENGNELWVKERKDKISWSSPMIAQVNNKPQLVLMGNPGITAYDLVSGDQLWRVECLMGEVGASACSYNGIIYGASEYATMVAIDGTDGKVLWESSDYLPEVASPVATESNLYIATSYGVVASFNTETGELKKEHETNAEFYSSPIMAEGRIYLISNDGTMHIFKANDEFALLDSFETGEMTYATPAFTDGKIVVRTNNSIYCVEAN
ncbi:PQQ-binding-like beta-propeller repeat protein [Carboxylicivirga sp. M1479]|uniref:outer membrane protein assembly factor BamB family protein n=1 Tax=Carboxylicivirga sp. M1479 TaxID=2594476 RepID=UPI001178AC62|nr:PQQ-binding-like beta-propeller repeat protein [Carboxylicivirga sp. M1479]TRX70614.1 PQQ-binding-like beta-propeller repeat protein [Carboxylicivirga sp. M1479]